MPAMLRCSESGPELLPCSESVRSHWIPAPGTGTASLQYHKNEQGQIVSRSEEVQLRNDQDRKMVR